MASIELDSKIFNGDKWWKHSREPVQAIDRRRNFSEPSGLKNIGNTCYFSSIT